MTQPFSRLDYDSLYGIVLGGDPLHFVIPDELSRYIAKTYAIYRAQLGTSFLENQTLIAFQSLTKLIDKNRTRRFAKDLSETAKRFEWPLKLYLEYKVNKETANKLAELTESMPPGLDLHLACQHEWPGYLHMLRESVRNRLESDEDTE